MVNMNEAASKAGVDNRVTPEMLRRLVIAFIAFMPVVVAFKILYEMSGRENIQNDMAFLAWIRQFGSPALDHIAVAVTSLGDPLLIAFITTGILVYMLRSQRIKDAAFVFFGVTGAAAIGEVLRFMFQRSRPDLWTSLANQHDYAFPSGHTIGASALAVCLMVLLWNTRWRWAAIIFGTICALLVGLSRLYLGVHSPADVVAGWAVSLVWVLLIKLTIDTSPQPKGAKA